MKKTPPRAFEHLLKLPGGDRIVWGFTTRRHPVKIVHSSQFARLSGRFWPHVSASCVQVHSDRIVQVRTRDVKGGSVQFPGSDGLISKEEGARLVVFSADCLPVFIVAPGRKNRPSWIALVHAGWKGTERRIAAKAVRRLAALSGTPPSRFRVFFGPALRSCCYEVGPEFKEKFPRTTRRSRGRLVFDLAAENKRQLTAEGVEPRHIRDTGHCTSCRNDLFYCYRKEKDEAARLVSWIVKNPR